MTRLKLHLLGSFEATLDDAILDSLRSDKVRALLAFLAAEGTHHHRREFLASLLWSEFSEKSARANLRVSLANLRQALLLLESTKIRSPFLLITRQNVQLDVNHKYCWVDSIAYDKLLAVCKSHAHTSVLQCPECMQRFTQAISLYRGGFLNGLTLPNSPTFDEWRLFQQETRHQQALSTLSLLTTYHLNQKNHEQAQHYAMRQIELEPWREEAYRQLMQILVLNGQRNSALTQYESCRRVLAQELGAEPVIETTMLYEQIKAGSFEKETSINTVLSNIIVPQHNLPAHTTPFVGREIELEQVTEILKSPECRLLTLIGPGGIGKTRLALQAATKQMDSFKDGVYLVSLVGVDSAQRLIATLAQVLQFSFYNGQTPQAQLRHFLREKRNLLIFDSFEYLLAAADTAGKKEATSLVVDLLHYAPALKILVVSRERLNVHGEWLISIGGLNYPLDLPPPAESVNQFGAIQLFTQSARRVQPNYTLTAADLPHVLKICQLVDGMPLAIELAAAWLRLLNCQEIVQDLQNNLDFLTSAMQDVPERHRNLRAVFDYSWQRLSARERHIYGQLSVFGDDFDRVAAENISSATPLDLVSLVDKSLLVVTSSPETGIQTRYTMHDLLRRYAADKLSNDPAEQLATRQRYSLYYLLFLQQAEPKLKSQQQLEALQTLGIEIENIRQAWQWAITHHKIKEINSAIESLFLFYYMRSWFQEGEAAFSQLVQALSPAETYDHQATLHKAMVCQGWFTFHLDRQETAKALLEKSLLGLRTIDAPAETAFCLGYLGAICQHMGNYGQANQLCRESLLIYRELNDNYGAAIALNILGRVAYLRGNTTEAELLYQESLALHREIGDHWGIAFSLEYLGQIAFAQQSYQVAQALFEESLTTRHNIGDLRGTALCYNFLGNTAIALGNITQAEQLYNDALALFKGIGHQVGISQSLANLEQIIGYHTN